PCSSSIHPLPLHDALPISLVRMAQEFSMRLLLVDGQGNFGSVDGDPPAAMRYTEVRLQRAALSLLADIDEDTVDFQDNYDNSERSEEHTSELQSRENLVCR